MVGTWPDRASATTTATFAPGTFTQRLTAFAQAYVRFASRDAALFDLMVAAPRRPGADPRLRQAGDRAFEAPLALIADAQADGDIVAGGGDRAATATLAMLQGLTWLATSDMIGDRSIDAVVAETIETLIYGLRDEASS